MVRFAQTRTEMMLRFTSQSLEFGYFSTEFSLALSQCLNNSSCTNELVVIIHGIAVRSASLASFSSLLAFTLAFLSVFLSPVLTLSFLLGFTLSFLLSALHLFLFLGRRLKETKD